MGFKRLRHLIPIEELDYQILMDGLTEYSNKRDVISRLIREDKIIRIKKGLYIFGKEYRKGLVCKETLANQIYGPSYISVEYALSYYGMIPERVETITSITTGKSRKFSTPIGAFTYQHLPKEKYASGVVLMRFDEHHHAFMASPEKAILDQVYFSRGFKGRINFEQYFFEDLRIDESTLKKLSLSLLTKIAKQYSNARVSNALEFIRTYSTKEFYG